MNNREEQTQLLTERHREGKPTTVSITINHDPAKGAVGRVCSLINSAPKNAEITVKGTK